ncbi:hypothetical protein EUAN_13540 [Andreesenia angusta]|uniref:ATPase dynein-related AAA domain-containing protein n=1 Tax=Andreesenia angusta TaxID=39480 RepID=A0A1S1V704_9FIRM|nr:AAA family ATPase [Andreesenia angusta]OHW62284.1 hypothetical protein EUAN_13540 [Andreesenia angusta]
MFIESAENQTKLKTSNNCYLLGVLATSERIFPRVGEDQDYITTFANSYSLDMIFYVKSLSIEPDPIIEFLSGSNPLNPLYIGLYNDTEFSQDMDYRHATTFQERRAIIEEKLKDKLIIFKPKINFGNDNKPRKNLEIISVKSLDNISQDIEYIPVPKVNNTDNFEKKIFKKDFITFEDYSHAQESPEFVVSGDYLYQNEIDWRKHETTDYVWRCEDPKRIKRIKLGDFKDAIIDCTDNLVFIDKNFNINNLEGYTYLLQDDLALEVVKTENYINSEEENTEASFLEEFKNYAKVKEKLCYSDVDLANFHTCIKTNPLTILAGMSGTGKTQLALAYAKMLDLSEENKTLLFLPISPSYTEPSDLLGYFNNMNGLFVPSETGLADILIHASNNPEKMHMVIFDEMNLSQVEYWFAPFISLLEKKPRERKLNLYSSNTHCINSHIYKSSVILGENILFVGTINLDETTKDFSDRLLDRANLIFLNKKSFMDYRIEQEYAKDVKLSFGESICDSYDIFSSWVSSESPIEMFGEEELVFFDELHDMIQKFDSQKGVSFRVVRKIGEYLINIPVDEEGKAYIPREDALDLVIRQRIITKLKGTRKQYEKLIGIVECEGEEPKNSILYTLFSSAESNKISHFNETKKEICRKAKDLYTYGYTS